MKAPARKELPTWRRRLPEPMSSLPHSIEAVFYIKPSPTQRVGCGVGVALSGNKCTRYAKQAHANMRAHFGLNAQELPFVMFDPWDWDKPFSDANPELLDV